jgi:hypothetical protein
MASDAPKKNVETVLLDGAKKFLDFFQPDPQAGQKIMNLAGSSGNADHDKAREMVGDQSNKNRKPPFNLI